MLARAMGGKRRVRFGCVGMLIGWRRLRCLAGLGNRPIQMYQVWCWLMLAAAYLDLMQQNI
jgi:hypothetical protein